MNRERFKGFVTGILTTTLIMAVSLTVFATVQTIKVNGGVKLKVDGAIVTPKDANGNVVDVFEYNGTTYIPARAVSQLFGKEISWDGASRTVILGATTEQTIGTVGTVLMDKNGVKITYKGIAKNTSFLGGYEIKLLIENISDTPYMVQMRDLSINGLMINGSFSSTIAAGKKINDSIKIFEDDLKENSITTISSAEFYFTVVEKNDWMKSFDSDIVTI